mmetsp:Transcript_3800/g.12045  ORF Transcript_3800/g.12045 Transcript_3800/m.12045 type:complete len:230 (+) Transcript_3800:332-1021(+)
MLHHVDSGVASEKRRCAGRSRRNGEDGDDERPCPQPRHRVLRVQLLRSNELPFAWTNLQGSCDERFLGLLRRVQSHFHRSAFGRRDASRFDPQRVEDAEEAIPIHGRRNPDHQLRGHVDHDEPRLRGANRAPRKHQVVVPALCHVRAGPEEHLRNHARRRRFLGGEGSRAEVRHFVPTEQGAVVAAAPLRLGSSRCEVGAVHRRFPEAWRPRHARTQRVDACAPRHKQG